MSWASRPRSPSDRWSLAGAKRYPGRMIHRPHRPLSGLRLVLLAALLGTALPGFARGQVHYHEDGNPWKQRAGSGPDAEVEGWFYNLGIAGLRVQLVAERPTHLLVKHVFDGAPAARKVRPGDWIVGVGGESFRTEHRNGYGMDVFGPEGPILDFARALEESQDKQHKGLLALELERDGKALEVQLRVGRRRGVLSPTYPAECKKSELLLERLYAYIAEQQGEDGSWGNPVINTFAPLALLASGERSYARNVEKNARWHARTTQAVDDSSLINWRYMSAGIVLGEYYLATKERWVLAELEEIYTFLLSSQYTDTSQIDEKTRAERPQDLPKTAMRAHGGWGHNPGFEGYGPISMLTGQGALTLALLKHCGVDVDRERHDAAYAFLQRGSGRNAYLWYADEAAGQEDWADMGRTGAAGLANLLSPYDDKAYRKRAQAHALVIGEHPESFADTHGSPLMGMGYAALAANANPESFRRLMDANRWWFTLAECSDGSFYYQPNRDNAGYGGDSRLAASAVTALILSIPRRNLHVTGKPFAGAGR